MLKEEECSPNSRYLRTDRYFSESSIKVWQEQCIQRCREREKGAAYEKFINWKRQENQIAVFTLYAYADFNIPKWFDCIFQLENPKNNLKIKYELTQSVFEGWYPIDSVEHGHKHLCIFSFEEDVPEIVNFLYKDEGQFSTPLGQSSLGFCNSNDFEAIKMRAESVIVLKRKHGGEWWNYDISE